jgi:GH25 family lysozyme M1 (1,4-beta-N-acetylmuramidase)
VEHHRLIRILACSIACLAIAAVPARAARPLGIDVSHYQGTNINWTSVKNQGVTFAWTKATEGYTYNDDTFTTNETHAKSAGVYIGAYHYARPDNQIGLAGADMEASHFWSIAGPYIKGGDAYLMPMLDIEQNPGSSYNKTSLSQWVNRWCNDIVAYGANSHVTVTPVVYTYISYASTWLDSTVSQNWPLWMANYNGQNSQTGGPNGTSPWATWQFWQYTSSAKFQGIGNGTANVDADVLNGGADVLKDYVVGSAGRFDDGTFVQTTASLNVWSTPASTGRAAVEPAGAIGTILQGPVYGASYQRWQIQFADGRTGWCAEDYLALAPSLAGDFNGDGQVDAADYIAWKKGLSPNPHSSADYTAWRQHFGQSIFAAGTGLSGADAVPEPATLACLAFAPVVLNLRRRRHVSVRRTQ